jgi:hypothetical protein
MIIEQIKLLDLYIYSYLIPRDRDIKNSKSLKRNNLSNIIFLYFYFIVLLTCTIKIFPMNLFYKINKYIKSRLLHNMLLIQS